MKRIATVSLLFVLACGVLAAGPDEDYLAIYNQIQQAEALEQSHQYHDAADRYQQALEALLNLRKEHPTANVAAVSYRLEYLADKLKEKEIAPFVSTNAAVAVTAEVKPAAPVVALTPQQQAALQSQIQALAGENAQLKTQLDDVNARLHEALSVQPAAAAPGELDKARKTILSLEKERDLLRVTLDQLKAALEAAPKQSAANEAEKAAEIAGLKQKLDEAQKKLSETTAELNDLKSRPAAQPPAAGNLEQLTAERDDLKKQLAAVSKELAESEAHARSAAATPPATAPATAPAARAGAAAPPANAAADAAKIKALEAERDDLKKEVEAMVVAAGPGSELEQLRARVAVLESAPVPYTAAEQAVLNGAPSAPLAEPPASVKESSAAAHSAKDLSPGAISILQAARLDIQARRYDDAEKKYNEVLREDQNNLYVLCRLGSAQYDAGQMDDCEKTARRALALDPDDPGSLYLLGVIRRSQGKLDEALDALSRSAALNATNAGTQFYIGSILADKGLRPQAESALRKALAIDPNFADAHFALALIYASGPSPSPALARSHYEKSLELGHAKSDKLEKMLPSGN